MFDGDVMHLPILLHDSGLMLAEEELCDEKLFKILGVVLFDLIDGEVNHGMKEGFNHVVEVD